MKNYFIITLCCLLIFLAKGQQLGKETWTEITHEVKQLLFINENIQCELESLIFHTKQDTMLNDFKRYKYFHLYVRTETSSKIFDFQLSNYPYKSKNLIGFFVLRGYLVFVHNELPDFLKSTEHTTKFSYTEHKVGNILMMEDDTGSWSIEYIKPSFKVLHYPAKRAFKLIGTDMQSENENE